MLRRVLVILCASACLGSLLPVPAAQGSPSARVIFSDGTFDPADWSLEVLKTRSGSSASVEQRLLGGNPGAFRRVFHQVANGSYASPSEVVSLHQRRGADYDPAVQGPIGQVCYSEDAFILDGFGQGQSTGPALWQGGRVYRYFVGPTYMPADWLRRAAPALVATDFVELLPTVATDPASHPDFSGTGAPITFGFFRANTSRGTGWPLDGAIDNWVVDVNCHLSLPSPTATETPTATATATATRTATPPATPSATRTWTSTVTATSTPTPSPSATSTSSPTASATSTPTPTTALSASPSPTLPPPPCVPLTRGSDIALVLDRSSSMDAANKLRDARSAVMSFIELAKMPPDQIALVTFAAAAGVNQPLTTDKDRLRSAVQAVITGPGTRIDLGLSAARGELESERHDAASGRVIVLLSDGVQNGAPNAAVLAEAEAARAAGMVVFTIGLGPDADLSLLRRVATSEAHAFFAPTSAEMADIYRRISVVIPCSGLAGQVFIDRDEDGRYDPAVDAPLAGVGVKLDGPVVRQTRSDAGSRGNYGFADVPAGRYTVTLDAASILPGLAPGGAAAMVVDLGPTPRLDVDFGLRREGAAATPTAPGLPSPGPSASPGATSAATAMPRGRVYLAWAGG